MIGKKGLWRNGNVSCLPNRTAEAAHFLPEQVVDAVEEPNEEDVLFGFLCFFAFLAVVERFERVADRSIPFKGDHRDVCRRAVDGKEGEIDMRPTGKLTENKFIWFGSSSRERTKEKVRSRFGKD